MSQCPHKFSRPPKRQFLKQFQVFRKFLHLIEFLVDVQVFYAMLARLSVLKNRFGGALLLCPCFFHPSDNVWRSRRTDAPRWAHFSTVISPSWITEQMSVGKCAHRGASARRERQTSFKIVTWTKQKWTKHHNTELTPPCKK